MSIVRELKDFPSCLFELVHGVITLPLGPDVGQKAQDNMTGPGPETAAGAGVGAAALGSSCERGYWRKKRSSL